MPKTCSVLNCQTGPGPGKFFYKFPTDFDMCLRWIQNTGNEALWQDFQYGGAYAFIDRHVCSKHFSDIDFAVFGDRDSGLRPVAVPLTATVKPDPLDPVELPEDHAGRLSNSTTSGQDARNSKSVSKAHFLEQNELETNPNDSRLLANVTIKTEMLEVDNNVLQEDTSTKGEKRRKFFEDRTPLKMSLAEKRAEQRRNETPEQRAARLEKNRIRIMAKRNTESETQLMERRQKSAERASKRRANESEEQRLLRLEKTRIRTAERRKNMTPEQKELWRLKNRIQTRERRQNEDEVRKLIRRYNNAVRASLKRSQETDEERMIRRYKDALRAAERRKTETPEEREERLRKDRERVQLRRMEIKLTETTVQREERLRRGRERMYRKRHQTPEMLSILKSIHEHLSNTQMTKEHVTAENVNNLIHFVKSCHPNLSADYLENAVESILATDESNLSETSFSNEDSDSTFSTDEPIQLSPFEKSTNVSAESVVEHIEVKPELPLPVGSL